MYNKPPSKPSSKPPLRQTRQKSVGAIILNARNEVLILFSRKNKYWEFPKGKVERGERELDTLKREISEETGIKRFRLHPNFREHLYYSFRVGQLLIRKVVVYYLFKTGAPVVISEEHADYQWVKLEDVTTHLRHVNQRNLVKRLNSFLQKHAI